MKLNKNPFDKELVDFIFSEMPLGVIVFDAAMNITYQNRRAGNFLQRYHLPAEVTNVCGRIFEAMKAGKIEALFPGEVIMYQNIDGAPNRWIISLHICKEPRQFVSVFMSEEKMSNKINVNKARMQYRLTRRETDVVRRVIDGRSNEEIAEDLGIATQTVKDHLSNIYMKCMVGNRFGLICKLTNYQEPETVPPVFPED